MSDIVDRLKICASDFSEVGWDMQAKLTADAAAEIERLRGLAYAHTVPGPTLWKECWQDEVDSNENLKAEMATLRRELSDERASARKEAIEECARIVDERDWDGPLWEETTSDILDNAVTAIRSLASPETIQEGER